MNKRQQTNGEQLYQLITNFAEQNKLTTVEIAGYLETIKTAIFLEQQEKTNHKLPIKILEKPDLTQYR